MAFDKTKVLRAAERQISEGKIQAAIQEYIKIVDNDPSDFTILNVLGDLYVRVNNKDEAKRIFVRIAEHYRGQRFDLKAIAMYKKIERLSPGSLEVARALASLYEAQGLVVEARANYLKLADAYSSAGEVQQALEVLRRIADLDVNNTEIRLKLAEGYLSQGIKDRAAEAYVAAGAQFFNRGVYELAQDAYGRALAIQPNSADALSGFLATHIELGSADEAAEVLEKAVARTPYDPDLLSMLATAYVSAENAEAAERVTTSLLAREPASFPRLVEVAELYLRIDDIDACARILESIIERMLTAAREQEVSPLVEEMLARDPDGLRALRLLVRICTWQRDDEKARSAFERLAEAAQAAGDADEERYAMTQLVRLVPEHTGFMDRLVELGGSVDDADVDVPVATTDREIPTFETFLTDSKETLAEETSPIEQPFDFKFNDVLPAADSSASFADLNEQWGEIDLGGGDQLSETSEEVFFEPLDSIHLGTTVESQGREIDTERRDFVLKKELESVDFYLSQGYLDIAVQTLDMLERQFGSHPEIQSRREYSGTVQSEATEKDDELSTLDFAAFELSPESEATEPLAVAPNANVQTEAPAQASRSGLDPGLAEIFDEFRTAVEDEEPSTGNGDYETHYNLGIAYKEMDLVDEAVEEFQMASNLVSAQDGTPRYLQCCNLIGHCFMQKGMPKLAAMWFSKGVETPGHTAEEYQALRFELGIALEQMGEIEKAIDVFSEIYGLNVSYRGVSNKLRELQEMKAASQ